jgi:thiol-disulfide isomerase/thioredoxin
MAKNSRFTVLVIILTVLLLSACRSGAPSEEAMTDEPAEAVVMEAEATKAMMPEKTATLDTMMDQPTDSMMQETPAQEAMMDATDEPEEMVETPSWYGVELISATTGEAFRISDFEGKVVLVETMAIWCTTCRAQQGEIEALHEELGQREDFISVTLDVDPNEEQSDLKAYVEQNSFDWLYAIAPAGVSREIGMLYGDQFLNPPSAPVFIIDKQGMAHALPFGLKSADELYETVNQYLDET